MRALPKNATRLEGRRRERAERAAEACMALVCALEGVKTDGHRADRAGRSTGGAERQPRVALSLFSRKFVKSVLMPAEKSLIVEWLKRSACALAAPRPGPRKQG